MAISEDIFYIFAWISAVILVFGILLNVLVCVTFLTYRSLLTNENILLLSMAFGDLLCSVAAIPTSMISNFNKKWTFEDSGCKVHAFIVTWCGLVSITHLAALAYHRYETMILRQDKLIGGTVLYVVVALWAYSFCFAIAPVAGWSRYTTEGIGTSCSADWQASNTSAVSYTVFIFLGGFVIPVGVIVFSYYKVYREIRTMVGKANTTWGKKSMPAKESLKCQRKMAALLFAMNVAFFLAWTPYAVVSLISAFGRPHWISPLTASVPAILAKSSNLYNPVLYFMVYQRFRQYVLNLLRFRCCSRSPQRRQDYQLALIRDPTKKASKLAMKSRSSANNTTSTNVPGQGEVIRFLVTG